MLAALASVDVVILFSEEPPLSLIRNIRPDIMAKGADYTEAEVVGRDEVMSWGGEVALVEILEGKSSSLIVNGIRQAND